LAITDGKSIATGALTLNGFNVGATTSDGVSVALSAGSAISKANAINAIAAKTGVTASAKPTVVTLSAKGGETETKEFKFLLNGVVIAGQVEFATAGATDDAIAKTNVGSASNIAAAINSQTSKTGVFATIGEAGKYTLTASDGRNIVLSTDTASVMKADGFDPALANNENLPFGFVKASWGTTGIDFDGTLNLTTAPTGWTNLSVGDKVASSDGKGDSRVVFGSVDISTDSLQGITFGGLDANEPKLGLKADNYVASSSAGSGVGSVNLNTSTGSQSALSTLDRAINVITDMRASMGAYQNRLIAAISNLENTNMNLSASRSRILDTDYAKETTNLAKAQIIQQAATAMLAQANQSAQSVLALLK